VPPANNPTPPAVPVVPTTTATAARNTPTAPKGTGQVVNRAAPKKSFLQKLFG